MRYEIFSDSNNPILNIISIGYTQNPQISRYGPSFREQYIIHYCISGKGYFNNTPIIKGQGFLITPDMFQEYHPDTNTPWEFIWIISEDKRIHDIFSKFNADSNTMVFNFFHFEKLYDIKNFLINSKKNIYSSYLLLEMFLSILNDSLNPLNNKEIYNSSIYFKAAINYINTNINASVKELTIFLGISQPYLYKIFKEKTDLSPKQYIINQKLKKSKKLLTDSDLSITQIATSMGYGDVLDFSKFFSKRIGCSPQQFRKNRIRPF
ncbi:MAG: AraC family transcriptional regulator [Acutalibacteraceae bacterium]|nr:AraC family transcriptional regulator [Acutalibacteraceae bacterium]